MGDREVDARADIYAVGALLYEMIAGEPPFTGPTPQAIVTRSMTEAPRSLSATRTGLAADVNQVAMKALAKSPADRYSTATALAAALDQALDVTHSGARPVIARNPVLLHSRCSGSSSWLARRFWRWPMPWCARWVYPNGCSSWLAF